MMFGSATHANTGQLRSLPYLSVLGRHHSKLQEWLQERGCHHSVAFKLPMHLAVALLLSAAVLGNGAARAQAPVDDWETIHGVLNANDGNGGLVTGTVDEDPGTVILGDERDIRVVRDSSGGQISSEAFIDNGVGQLDHSQTSAGSGRSIIEWDGDDNDASASGFDETGLGGVNLSNLCSDPNPGFSLKANNADNDSDIDVTFEVYTDASNWSSLTRTEQGADEQASILSFEFADFNTQAGSGADFTNVGAVRMIIDAPAAGSDLTVLAPVASCGVDFGDAPDDRESGATVNAYQTLLNDALTGNLGAHHIIAGPFMGSAPVAIDAEADGQPNTSANGDDTDAVDDEDGVVFPDIVKGLTCDGVSVGDETYCAEVDVANPTASAAQVIGWVDFDAGGETLGRTRFNSSCSTTDGTVTSDCERSAARVLVGSSGLSDFGGGSCSESGASAGDSVGGTDFTTGNVPANCAGTVVLTWDLSGLQDGDVVDENTDTYGRVRITTDSNYFSNSGALPSGFAGDGEVEDHILTAGTLPVSIASFDSRFTESGLYVEWGTVSETRNVGFRIWGETSDGFQRLNETMIAAKPGDAVTPKTYSHELDGVARGDVERIAITAVDQRGNEKMYGLFEVNRAYGNKTQPAGIDWQSVRARAAQRLQARGFVRAGDGWRRGSGAESAAGVSGDTRRADSGVQAVDIRPTSAGMQRVTYQDLANAGLDLAGTDPGDIAVTVKGQAVPRHVANTGAGGGSGKGKGKGSDRPVVSANAGAAKGPDGTFGPGASINFWAQSPSYPDALYVDSYVYRVTVDGSKAVEAVARNARVKSSPERYTEVVSVNDDVDYHFASPLEDPWYAARLRANSGDDRHTTSISLGDELRSDVPARLTVTLGGLTDFPETPDHHVQVRVNGQLVDETQFDGQKVRELQSELPAGLLQPGSNTVEVLLPGGTDAETDIVLLDTVEFEYARSLTARSNRISIESINDTGGITVSGFTDTDTVAYGFDGQSLWTLPQEHFNRGSVRVPTVDDKGARYWLSTSDRIHRPEIVGGVSQQDLLADPANYLIIAHPSFLPQSAGSDHPLNTYIAQRESEGWDVGLYDTAEIQAQYGHGMALPEAVTNFLREAEQRFDYSHVLLVGDDSYDYRDHLGLGSVSFIPTAYTETSKIPHTPSDALLADLDGDGVSDKAIGRWPVRSETDLAVIVQKTLDWQADMAADASALWVTDSEDSAAQSFQSQAERMIDPLESAGWLQDRIDRVFFGEVAAGPDETQAEAARQQMIQSLEQGKSLTGFAGHGAPSMWTFQGLLTPDDVSAIDNEGMPTLISTLTCYTSYFVSPHTDTLAHRLMNGYREDAAGEPIPGVANGAVAIHGAATLSDYSGNESIAKAALQAQLQQGATLGEAIRLARLQAASQGLSDVVRNWTLLGDPTLLLQQ